MPQKRVNSARHKLVANAFAYLHAVVEVCPCAYHCCCAYHLPHYDASKAEREPADSKPGTAKQRRRKKIKIGEKGIMQDAFDQGTSIGNTIRASILRQQEGGYCSERWVGHCSGVEFEEVKD